MIPFTSAMCMYEKIYIKFKYVCALSLLTAFFYTLWIYVYLPLPSESRTFVVGVCVLIIRFIAALVLGSPVWLVYRYFRTRKPLKRSIDSEGM